MSQRERLGASGVRVKNRWLCCLPYAVVLGFLPGVAAADPWRHAISIPFGIDYDSNPVFQQPAEDVWRFRFVPKYSLNADFGRDIWTADLAARIERSTDPLISVEREDPLLNAGWRHLTENGEYGVSARYQQNSTRANQLDQTGQVQTDGTQATTSVTAHWSEALTERAKFSTYGVFSSLESDTGTPSASTSQAGGVNFDYALTDRIGLFVAPAINRFAPEDGDSTTRYTFSAGGKWQATENLSMSAQSGFNKTEGSGILNPQGAFWVRYQKGRHDFSVNGNFGGFTTGSQSGFSSQDTLSASWGYAIDERTRSGVDYRWSEFSGASSPTTTHMVGAWVSHDLSESWNLRLAYQYMQRERGAENDDGDVSGQLAAIPSHKVNLTISYSLPNL